MSRSEATAETALSFRDVSAVRGGRTIWSDGTFDIPAGSIVAVIGANGSGKTTLVQMVLGLVPLGSGTVRVFGLAPGDNNELIGYVPQHYAAAAGDAVRGIDAVLLGQAGRRWDLARTTPEQLERARRTLADLGAGRFADKRLSTLSGGQRQRVAIAEAMVSGPRMLILDEPLALLDIGSQRDTVVVVDRLRRERGLTVIVVAHDLNPLLPILDSAIYLLDGHAHYAPIGQVADGDLLTHLYGSPIRVVQLTCHQEFEHDDQRAVRQPARDHRRTTRGVCGVAVGARDYGRDGVPATALQFDQFRGCPGKGNQRARPLPRLHAPARPGGDHGNPSRRQPAPLRPADHPRRDRDCVDPPPRSRHRDLHRARRGVRLVGSGRFSDVQCATEFPHRHGPHRDLARSLVAGAAETADGAALLPAACDDDVIASVFDDYSRDRVPVRGHRAGILGAWETTSCVRQHP